MLALAPTSEVAALASASLPQYWTVKVVESDTRRRQLAQAHVSAGSPVILLRERQQVPDGLAFHGPREWAADGGLAGVFGDHQARYRWAAAQLTSDAVVLDCPCGTGYGSVYLSPAVRRYTGVDVDELAVRAASSQYWHPRGGQFLAASMTDLPAGMTETFSHVVSFEGFEHVEDHRQVAGELFRVLQPGGTLLLSTPVRGVANGTAWDRYMVTSVELEAFLRYAGFSRLEWFSQVNYGIDTPVIPGYPPAASLIQIVRAIKP